MNLRGLYNARKFLSSWGTVSFYTTCWYELVKLGSFHRVLVTNPVQNIGMGHTKKRNNMDAEPNKTEAAKWGGKMNKPRAFCARACPLAAITQQKMPEVRNFGSYFRLIVPHIITVELCACARVGRQCRALLLLVTSRWLRRNVHLRCMNSQWNCDVVVSR